MWTISRDTNPGQMRTRIRILRPVDSKTPGNYRNPKYEKLQFQWMLPFCRKYQVIKDFATEEEADAYLDGLFAGTSAVPGLSAPSQTEQTGS